ncbi:MAG: hypothetical protein H0X46_00845 [Bacteroidetes bacterium]|nr:hypothetical protein [Bacteroidota bacterium]
MKKLFPFLILILGMLFLTGCTTSFMGTVLVISFGDIIFYVFIAFIIALAISFKSYANRKRAFWIWFILSLLLTPLAGFIYLLILYSMRSEEN